MQTAIAPSVGQSGLNGIGEDDCRKLTIGGAMKGKWLTKLLAAVLTGLVSLNTHAASIWLEPASQDILPGGVAPLELWADASDVGGFLVGGLDVFYDETLLVYNDDFAFDPAFPTDPSLSRTGTNCFVTFVLGCSVPGEIDGIAFGSFDGLAADGPTLVGTLSFTGLRVWPTSVTMADNDLPAGGFFATDGTDLTGLVTYTGADFNIPIPAAMWLMISGLTVLAYFTRRHQSG